MQLKHLNVFFLNKDFLFCFCISIYYLKKTGLFNTGKTPYI